MEILDPFDNIVSDFLYLTEQVRFYAEQCLHNDFDNSGPCGDKRSCGRRPRQGRNGVKDDREDLEVERALSVVDGGVRAVSWGLEDRCGGKSSNNSAGVTPDVWGSARRPGAAK